MRRATNESMRASSVSVNTRIGWVTRYERSTPSRCATSTCASTRPMAAVASSGAAFRVRISAARREARELLGLMFGRQRPGDLVQVAVHDRVDLVEREIDTVIGHAPLREVVGADPVRAVARADEALAGGSLLVRLLLHLL